MEEKNQNKALYEHYKFKVDEGQNLLRVDKFLMNRIENTTRNKIQIAIKTESVLVNNKSVKVNYKVKPLDDISIVLTTPPRVVEIIPEDIPIDIIYEDDDFIVVNKKAGMVVHPGHGNYKGTLVNAIAFHMKDNELFSGDSIRPGLVHRIDKNTTGLLVVAKNEISMQILANYFFKRTIKRKYIALVWGNVNEDNGTINSNIGRSLKDRKKMHVFLDDEYGKVATTHYKVIERFQYTTLIECKLDTGRTHQIRVHLQHIGHPVFNDEIYGGNKILRGINTTKYKQFVNNAFKLVPHQFLHATLLGFVHPSTKKEMLFEKVLPDYMQELIEKWRNNI